MGRAVYHQLFTATVDRTHHPVVPVHPESRERVLQLGQFVSRILASTVRTAATARGLPAAHHPPGEHRALRWAPGDCAVWDNRATPHDALADHGDLPRRMHRVTIAGDVPVSIIGERSRAAEGDAAAYAGARS